MKKTSTQASRQSPSRALFAALVAAFPPLASHALADTAAASTTIPAPASAPAAGPVVELDPLEVIASPLDTADATALKFPVSLRDTPRAVSVIDADRIREQNFRTPNDTFYYTPGVFPNSTASGSYHFIARGYRMSPGDTLIDGFAGFYVGGGQSPQSLYGVERVAVLRGPAGLLYGASSLPGGMVNIITKKPRAEAATSIDVTTSTYAGGGLDVGDRSSLGVSIDSTGPLTADGRVLYRGIIAGDDSEHYTDDVLYQTRYYSGALTFLLGPEGRATFTPLVQFAHNVRPAGAAMVMSPSTSLTTNDGQSGPINTEDLSSFDVNLYDGGRTDDMLVAGFDFSARPVDPARVNIAYRYIDYDTFTNQWAPVVSTAAQRTQLATTGTVSRTHSKSRAERQSHNFDVNGSYEFEPADWWKDTVQAGFNGRFYNSTSQNATYSSNAPQSPINIYTGAIGSPLLDRSNGWATPTYSDDFYWNSYLQNQAAFMEDRWILTTGLGYGEQFYGEAAPGARRRQGDLTPNAGLVFHPVPALSLYASYSTSYSLPDLSVTYENAAGDTFTPAPITGVNHEIGAKYDLPNRAGSLAVALFHTERDNTLVQSAAGVLNPNGNRYYTEEAGQSARGIEFETEYRPLSNWRFNATFAYIDASYENGTAFAEPVAKTPEYSWSLYTRYDIQDGALKNLGASLGVVWQDERMGGSGARSATSPDPLMLPDFYRVDLGLFYRLGKHWDFALNVQNLLDETIFVDGTTGANLQVAAPRTLTLRSSYKF